MNHLQTTSEIHRFIWNTRDCYHNLLALQGDRWVVDAYQLLFARQLGILKKLPSLPIDELDDQNKGDALVQFLAVGQVIWLFVQLIARGAQDRTPSQLEIVVLAFSIYTLISVSTPHHGGSCQLFRERSYNNQMVQKAFFDPKPLHPLRHIIKQTTYKNRIGKCHWSSPLRMFALRSMEFPLPDHSRTAVMKNSSNHHRRRSTMRSACNTYLRISHQNQQKSSQKYKMKRDLDPNYIYWPVPPKPYIYHRGDLSKFMFLGA